MTLLLPEVIDLPDLSADVPCDWNGHTVSPPALWRAYMYQWCPHVPKVVLYCDECLEAVLSVDILECEKCLKVRLRNRAFIRIDRL